MKLEVGKRYKDEAGRVCTVLSRSNLGIEPFIVDHGGVMLRYHCEDGKAVSGGDCNLASEIIEKPATKFKVGKTYTTRCGDTFKCINVNADGSAHLATNDYATAYLWAADGSSVSLGGEWDIVFQPAIEWIEKKASITTDSDSHHTFTIRFPLIDGKPDWSQAEVRECD